MSRSGYTEDCDNNWDLIMWRGAVASAIRGKRGQSFLKEMLAAIDAMPVKALVKGELHVKDEYAGDMVCAIGAVGRARGLDMTDLDPEEKEKVAAVFKISPALAAEIVYMNDEYIGYWARETPEQRFVRMRSWIVDQIRSSRDDHSARPHPLPNH